MEELNGIKLKGNTLRVEWSKSVPNMPREPLTLDRLYEMYPRLKPSSHSHRHRHDDDHDADEHRSHHHHHHSSSHSSSAPDRHCNPDLLLTSPLFHHSSPSIPFFHFSSSPSSFSVILPSILFRAFLLNIVTLLEQSSVAAWNDARTQAHLHRCALVH